MHAAIIASKRWRHMVSMAFAATVLWSTGVAAMVIKGEAFYRERILLPPATDLVVELLDGEGEAGQRVARVQNLGVQGSPLKFRLHLANDTLVAGHTYQLRARLEHNGQVLFATLPLPLLPEALNLKVQQAGAMAVAALSPPLLLRALEQGEGEGEQAQVMLRGSYWKLITLAGQPSVVADGQPEPHLVLDVQESRVMGSAGCNNFSGDFELNDSQLRFPQLASTLRACAQRMEQESAFFMALDQVRHYRLSGESLLLLDDQQRELARFQAVALP